MVDLDKLSIGKLSELTNGDREKFRDEVENSEYTLDDLQALKEAEKSGQNREELIGFLDEQINAENVSNYLNLAERDIGEIEGLVKEIENVEDIKHLKEEQIEIDQDELIDLMGGTVEEMKEFVKENPLTSEQLENVLDAEERIKDRKTAKQFLERQIKKREVGEDVEEARKDIESLEGDLEDIREDETGILEEKNQNNSGNDEEEDADSEDSEGSKEENAEDKESESEETEDENQGSDEEEKEGGSEEENEESDEESEENEEEDSKFERKKELSEELELDISDEELENFSLEQLDEIKSEKEHRESLIERLEEDGMDEEDLREASTADLEKLAEGLDSKDETQEEHEEMREEAEEDLEMLMGAVRGSDDDSDEDTGGSAKEKLEDLKENIRDKLNRSGNSDEDNKSAGLSVEKLDEILDEYRQLGDEEASVKTAHIMKGFLEEKLGIERELTYKELAEEMPTDEGEEIEELAEFFVKMHREQYTGRLHIDDSDQIIDNCEKVAEQLS